MTHCLVSQEFKQLIQEGRIKNTTLSDTNIQPSTFEPVVADDIYVLDMEAEGLRPSADATIAELVQQLPAHSKKKFSLKDGFELKVGFTYLIPLREQVQLNKGEFIIASPKSSLGRVFLNTRLLSDYNPCFNEINSYYSTDFVSLWVLVQPLAFNLVLHPDIPLNQLLFFQGHGAELTPQEVLAYHKEHPLVYERTATGEIKPFDAIITDALQIHLNLEGKFTQGIVGLRARRNPVPIDLSKKYFYSVEDYFEPLYAKDKKLVVMPKHHYLLSSQEFIKIPNEMNAEILGNSPIGLQGPLHFAGFFDNGFFGDLVYEVRPDEIGSVVLTHGMPMSKIRFFRTKLPDKLYGEKIGSHYHGQVGPKVGKYFKPLEEAKWM